MKCFAFSSSFAKIIVIMFLFSFASAASAVHTDEDFLHCLTNLISNNTSTSKPIFYTSKDPSYSTILLSSIQNKRYTTSSTPKPLIIVTPFYASHVQATVYCSKKHGIQIRTRSGGHDYEGLSSVSDVPFVLIDLRNLNLISVNTESKSAWVQAGATLGELYYKIAEKSEDLGFPAGDCHSVGVGGLIGGGGYGYLTRKYGLAADNILDAEFVDAEGSFLNRKSMGEDLFWAIRGGGPASFGIVLAWKIQLVPVPSIVTVFDVDRSMEDNATKKFFHRWQRRANKVDEDLSIYVRFQTVSSIDNEGNKKVKVQAFFRATFHGRVESLLQLMQEEFPELGLLRQECSEMRWAESFLYFNAFRNGESLDALLDRTSTYPLQSFKAKCDFVKEPIPDDVVEGMLAMLYEEEVGQVLVDLFPMGGKMDNISESTIPFPYRAGNLYYIHYLVDWETKESTTTSNKHVRWLSRLYKYLTPYVSKNPRAAYINFRDLDIGMNQDKDDGCSAYDDDTQAKTWDLDIGMNKDMDDTWSAYDDITRAKIWGPKYFNNNFNRLVYVKTLVDPTNFFKNEQSIPPFFTY